MLKSTNQSLLRGLRTLVSTRCSTTIAKTRWHRPLSVLLHFLALGTDGPATYRWHACTTVHDTPPASDESGSHSYCVLETSMFWIRLQSDGPPCAWHDIKCSIPWTAWVIVQQFSYLLVHSSRAGGRSPSAPPPPAKAPGGGGSYMRSQGGCHKG